MRLTSAICCTVKSFINFHCFRLEHPSQGGNIIASLRCHWRIKETAGWWRRYSSPPYSISTKSPKLWKRKYLSPNRGECQRKYLLPPETYLLKYIPQVHNALQWLVQLPFYTSKNSSIVSDGIHKKCKCKPKYIKATNIKPIWKSKSKGKSNHCRFRTISW